MHISTIKPPKDTATVPQRIPSIVYDSSSGSAVVNGASTYNEHITLCYMYYKLVHLNLHIN